MAISGKQVTLNPREWKSRRSFRVRVGIGHAGKSEKIAVLQTILQLHEKIIPAQGGGDGPLLGLEHVHHAMADLAEATGVRAINRYFRDPATYTPPPPQEAPIDKLAEVEEAKAAANAAEAAARVEIERERLRLEEMKIKADLEIQKMKLEVELAKLNKAKAAA